MNEEHRREKQRKSVGNRIKKVSKQLNITIVTMSNYLGISRSTLNSYIRGLALPPKELREKMAGMVMKSEQWLLHGELKDYITETIIENKSNYAYEIVQEVINKLIASLEPLVNDEYPLHFEIINSYMNLLKADTNQKTPASISASIEQVSNVRPEPSLESITSDSDISKNGLKPNKEEVAARINEIRLGRGLSFSQMAESLNISKSTLNNYIRGRALPSSKIRVNIAKMALKSEDWLLHGEFNQFAGKVLRLHGYSQLLLDDENIIERIKQVFGVTESTDYPNSYEIINVVKQLVQKVIISPTNTSQIDTSNIINYLAGVIVSSDYNETMNTLYKLEYEVQSLVKQSHVLDQELADIVATFVSQIERYKRYR